MKGKTRSDVKWPDGGGKIKVVLTCPPSMEEKRATRRLKRKENNGRSSTYDSRQLTNILNQNRITTGVTRSMTEVVITRLLPGSSRLADQSDADV